MLAEPALDPFADQIAPLLGEDGDLNEEFDLGFTEMDLVPSFINSNTTQMKRGVSEVSNEDVRVEKRVRHRSLDEFLEETNALTPEDERLLEDLFPTSLTESLSYPTGESADDGDGASAIPEVMVSSTTKKGPMMEVSDFDVPLSHTRAGGTRGLQLWRDKVRGRRRKIQEQEVAQLLYNLRIACMQEAAEKKILLDHQPVLLVKHDSENWKMQAGNTTLYVWKVSSQAGKESLSYWREASVAAIIKNVNEKRSPAQNESKSPTLHSEIQRLRIRLHQKNFPNPQLQAEALELERTLDAFDQSLFCSGFSQEKAIIRVINTMWNNLNKDAVKASISKRSFMFVGMNLGTLLRGPSSISTSEDSNRQMAERSTPIATFDRFSRAFHYTSMHLSDRLHSAFNYTLPYFRSFLNTFSVLPTIPGWK